MSTLTMPSSPYPHGFPRELAWQDARSEPSPRSRERIALPSIRQAFPELQIQIQQETSARTPRSATTPTRGPFNGTITPPEYIHSPTNQKRRRLSFERFEYFEREKEAERTNQIPRIYNSPHGASSRQPSPPLSSRISSEAWNHSSRPSPHTGHGTLPFMRSPVKLEPRERVDTRPVLPSLPLLNFERGTSETHRIRSHHGDEYAQETMRRPSIASNNSHGTEASSPVYRPANFGYGFHHPSRVQSLSVGSVHPFDRTPFSPGPYGHQFQDNFMRIGEFGMGMNGDSKQRKRRGNLPKETTDKLRAWFVAHLHHPYPSEEEKHDLMRQTGLQMNQISNWFINARRRQLPTMINNARAESDAMTVRGGESNLLPSTERIDYDTDSKPLSDGEGSTFRDVELESIKRRRTNINRGSI
ncbi:hypothetical protein F4677DRAFT_392016 [Hypoxylon crocopeplum]|nr:hypothetical protein F4677DRAFT_392016 [Hypoxylon crocopeplum]